MLKASKQRFVKPFTYLLGLAAAVICFQAALNLPLTRLDEPFLLLTLITIFLGSRLTIQIPQAKVHISVSDSLIFLTLLIYGGEAAVLLAACEACYASFRFRKKGIFIRADGILFNVSLMACSAFLTSLALTALFAPVTEVARGAPEGLINALCVMALVQYVTNSGLASLYTAFETNSGIWSTWSKHYFPTSITYIAGAAAAGILIKLSAFGFNSVVATITLISLVYITLCRYIDDLRASGAQAEQAERARAEAERETAEAERKRAEVERQRAEQAEHHVRELNRHIAEQERISKELDESKEHFRYAAYHDGLTELPNRAFFVERLAQAIERTKRERDYSFAVLFLDLDRFKTVNDSLGHSYGDQLLIATARRLQECIDPADTVARFGGDEFAVLLEKVEDVQQAVLVAEKIQQCVKMPLKLDDHRTFTTTSIGIALSTGGYERPEEILRDADTATYRAKEKGNARYEVFNETMHARALTLLKLENDLRQAIERREFCNYYQPIVHIASGELAGFEALVRWHHPLRGVVSPAEFISVAEDTGMIMLIGLHVLEEACRQLRQWQKVSDAANNLTVSVNLSGTQIFQSDLLQEVKRTLIETDLDPACLKLEITESVVMGNAEEAFRVLNQLRDLGVKLSIDDFGTGYSSLSYLHRFPVDVLKIDRSFVNRIGLDKENLEIARTIVTLAHSLKMEVIAEGVESIHQQSLLRTLGCEYGQGYLYSRPLTPNETETLILNQNPAAVDGELEPHSHALVSELVV